MSKEFHLNDTLMSIGLIAVLLFLAVSLLINTGKSCDTNIQFIVVGSNETLGNDTVSNQTLLNIKYDCTKICIDKFYSGGSAIKDCWNQCNSLGGE
jgi:hypothetical protein